jgi:hypothetical protein
MMLAARRGLIIEHLDDDLFDYTRKPPSVHTGNMIKKQGGLLTRPASFAAAIRMDND